jgi:hypothetical protein
MNKQALELSIAATLLYGKRIATRRVGGIWVVVLPPHQMRATLAAQFRAAGVTVLPEIMEVQ